MMLINNCVLIIIITVLLKRHCIDILIMRLYDCSYRYMMAWHYDIDRHMICGTQVDHVPTC